jgi:YHS domain-containing protein
MILRITYCTVAVLLCIGIGLFVEAPEHLIAETEPDQIQSDEDSEEFLLRSIVSETLRENNQNRSRMSSEQILNDALQRELNLNGGFQQTPTLQIRPATVSSRSGKKSLTITPLQKAPRRKTGLKSRNSGSLVITSTQASKISGQNGQFDQPGLLGEKEKQSLPLPALAKQEVVTATQSDGLPGEVVLSAAKSDSSTTVPAGFLKSPKSDSADEGKKSSLSLFKRAIKGLNRRSEPQTGATAGSRSSAPRRFIPTNPKPVSQDATSIRRTGESAYQGKIVQAQQNSSITRELKKLYRKDGRQMPQIRTPNQPRVPQGAASNQGFAPKRIAPGNSPGNQQSANTQKKPPIWKRLFSIGRKKQPPQNQQSQQPQYNPPPQQVQQPQNNQPPQFNNQPRYNPPSQQPQYSQQPQFNQQPSSQQLPRVPSSAPNYGSRNKPGVPGMQSPASSPFGRQNPTSISRNLSPFPGTRSRNSEPFQSVFPEKRRINGDAPQFDSFSDQFDPFAIPQEIVKPDTSPVNSVDAQSQKKADPFSGDFNPFEEPEESIDTRTQPVEPPQKSTTEPINDDFDPFGESENNVDTENATQDKKTESTDTTPAEKKSVAKPTERESNPFQEPEQSQQESPAVVPPVSDANEQSRKENSPEDSIENAFPDLSETEADLNNPDENPFTGLKLGGEPDDLNETSAVPAPQKPLQDAGNDEPPRSDDPQNTDETISKNPAGATENRQPHPIEITPAEARKPLETVVNKNSNSSPNSKVSKKTNFSQTQRKKTNQKETREKLVKISERAGLKGFKGFCPVALRDQRELINSKSKFKAVFESRIYYFSASDARDKFENNPEHYAPVHGGKDIVMLRDDEKKTQGSLDHAVWFKDRLYLFSDAGSLKTFIKTPKNYLENSSENSSENESAGVDVEANDSDSDSNSDN